MENTRGKMEADLKEVLTLHQLWLDKKLGGVKADLTEANLFGADLTEANLSGANLTKANLYGATLTEVIGLK